MPTTGIVADSGCDLPPDLVRQYEIRLVPLVTHFGEEELLDRPQTREQFWSRFDANRPPQTSGPAVGEWMDVFGAALQDHDSLVALTLTSKHSVTYNSAILAAAEFAGRVQVFDSWSLSLGEGLLTLQAARLAATGAPPDAIMAALAGWRSRLHITILLDTLDALQRGGRLAPVMAAIKRMSSLLSIKPILTMNEGTLAFASAARTGKRGRRHLVDALAGVKVEVAAVAHTRAPDLAADLAAEVASAGGLSRNEVLVAEAGPALAAHAGPGAMGVAFITAGQV